jgi:hypothetical protein
VEAVQEGEEVKAPGHEKCGASSNIMEQPSFGRGKLDDLGFWEIPCYDCARSFEKANPQFGECWPPKKADEKKCPKDCSMKGEAHNHCVSCGYPIHVTAVACGECSCEDDCAPD